MSEISKDNALSMEERKLGTAKIRPLFFAYTITAVLGMSMQVVMAIGDGFFVGNGIGAVGLGTIAVVYPFWILPISLGTMIGVGSSTLVGIRLGQGKKDEARAVVGQTFWFTILGSIILTVIILIFMDPILTFFGAQGEILDSARTYSQVFMIGFPLYVTGLVMFYLVRIDEKLVMSMLIQIIPAIIGLVVEYILIFRLDVGIAGSAIGAWTITLGAWFLLSFHFIFGKTELRIKLADIKPDWSNIKEVHKIGLAGFIIQVAPTIVSIAINNLIGVYGVESDFAVYGVINGYLLYILIAFTNSFGFGLLPIASFNYGAKLYSRVRLALLTCLRYTFGFMVICIALLFVFADQILTFFIGPVPELVAATREAVQVFIVLFPLGAMTIIIANYFQSVEKNGKAIVNSLTRNVIFILPLLFILPRTMGMEGVWISQPIADALSFVVAMIFLFREIKVLKQEDLS